MAACADRLRDAHRTSCAAGTCTTDLSLLHAVSDSSCYRGRAPVSVQHVAGAPARGVAGCHWFRASTGHRGPGCCARARWLTRERRLIACGLHFCRSSAIRGPRGRRGRAAGLARGRPRPGGEREPSPRQQLRAGALHPALEGLDRQAHLRQRTRARPLRHVRSARCGRRACAGRSCNCGIVSGCLASALSCRHACGALA